MTLLFFFEKIKNGKGKEDKRRVFEFCFQRNSNKKIQKNTKRKVFISKKKKITKEKKKRIFKKKKRKKKKSP